MGVDLSAALMQPVNQPESALLAGQVHEGRGTVILHVNSPLVPLASWHLGRRWMSGKYIIGYWAWELPAVPHDWRFGIPFVHEIWVPSAFTAAAMAGIAGDRPVRVVPYPVAAGRHQRIGNRAETQRPFTVLFIFNMASSVARKNPLATIAAFRTAFGDDRLARLIVKTSNSQVFPSGINSIRDAIGTARNIVLIDRTMSATEVERLYQESDVVMSLHRSEGFGLILAEAMLRGLPVVATDWSGNVDFLNTDNGIPIPYRLVPAEDAQGTYQHPGMMWAEADIEAAAEALRRLRREPQLARRLGEAGAAYAARVWSAHSYAETIRRQLGL